MSENRQRWTRKRAGGTVELLEVDDAGFLRPVRTETITPTPARSEAAGGEDIARDVEAVADFIGGQNWEANTLRKAAATIRSLRQQLAAAREDGERLDWMQEHYAEIGWLVPNSDPAVCEVWETHEGVRVVASWSASGDGPDLRSAIDAARSGPSGDSAC